MAELSDMAIGSGDDSTLSKGIDVEMLDYDYVAKCNDAKTLRGILSLLKSGKEGFYPEVLSQMPYYSMTYVVANLSIFSL